MGKGPLENTVEDYLVDKVKALGGVALKGAVPGRRFLDRIVILPGGRTIYVECKRPIGGRHSVHQGETLERLQALSHEIARVKTRAEVDTMLAPAPQTHLLGALRLAREWLPSVEPHIYDSENFKRDLAKIDAALAEQPAPKVHVPAPRWRVFEDFTHGWWGIEEDILDGNTILYPKKMGRDPLDGIVRAHNATLTSGVRDDDPYPGEHREVLDAIAAHNSGEEE